MAYMLLYTQSTRTFPSYYPLDTFNELQIVLKINIFHPCERPLVFTQPSLHDQKNKPTCPHFPKNKNKIMIFYLCTTFIPTHIQEKRSPSEIQSEFDLQKFTRLCFSIYCIMLLLIFKKHKKVFVTLFNKIFSYRQFFFHFQFFTI